MHGLSKTQRLFSFTSFLHKRWMVYYVSILGSLLLSYIASLRAVVINPDAICYIQSAVTMKLGLGPAMHICGQAKWPFFSILIYSLVSLTHFSYINAAFILDSIFSCISVIAFISIVRFLKDTPRLLWLAALVILLSHEFNSVREYVIRDHGFWAFYVVSILSLLHYIKNPRWISAFAWSSSILLSTLFRIEGIVFLILIPLVSFLLGKEWKVRLNMFFKLNLLTLAGILLIGGWCLTHPTQTMANLGRLGEVKEQLFHGFNIIIERFHANAKVLSEQVLSQYAHDAKLVLVLMLVSWYVLNVVSNVSLIYAAIVGFAWFKKLLLTSRENRVILWGYLILNVLITSFFLVENMFLSKRYLLALSLTLMIWVPFGLNKLYEDWPHRKGLWLVTIMLIIGSSLGGIFEFGHSKRYIRDAGQWIENNVPLRALVYSNDEQLMFYSQHFGAEIFNKSREFGESNIFRDGSWKNYDYIVLRTNKKKQVADNEASKVLGNPFHVFANQRGDQVNIYKIH